MSKILIVEDTLTQAKTLQHMLQPGGYEMRLVRTPVSAAQEATSFQPDIVLSDISMPEMNGYQLCEQFKADPRLQTIPFILLSGFSDIRELKKIVACGADAFIFKSFDAKFFLPRFQSIAAHVQSTDRSCQLTKLTVDNGTEIDISAVRLFNMLVTTYETAMFQQLSKPNPATVA